MNGLILSTDVDKIRIAYIRSINFNLATEFTINSLHALNDAHAIQYLQKLFQH